MLIVFENFPDTSIRISSYETRILSAKFLNYKLFKNSTRKLKASIFKHKKRIKI